MNCSKPLVKKKVSPILLIVIAAVLGAVFVGVGVGLCVRIGGATGGDDAIALVIAKVTGWNISKAYLLTDFTVLGLSLSYLPPSRIACSLLSVMLSGKLIGMIQRWGNS